MNKNVVIFILVVLIFIGGIWGSLADRKKIVMQKKLSAIAEQMEKLEIQTTIQREQVLSKTAGLQKTLTEKEEQVSKARKELVSLRRESKVLESQLSACNATVQKVSQEKNQLERKIPAAQGKGLEKTTKETNRESSVVVSSQQEAGTEIHVAKPGEKDNSDELSIQFLQEQLQIAELTIDRLRQKLDAGNAQMMGLEKLLEEKSSAMEETSQDMDRLKINMDVLLSKIADQRDELQEIQEETRDLVKELAAKNEEIADLQEEVIRQPVQE